MKYFLHILIFALSFQMEVRVRASADKYFESPENCWNQKGECAIHVNAKKAYLGSTDVIITAGSKSILIRESNKKWRFIEGTMWVEGAENIQVQTLYADIKSERGQFWLVSEGDTIRIRNISSELTLFLRDGKKMQMPEGFEVWIGAIDRKGESKVGMLEPIKIEEYLTVWNEYFRGTPDEFKVEVYNLKRSWGNLIEKSSELYRRVAAKHASDEEERLRKIDEARERRSEEVRKQKALLYERSFNR